MKPLAETSDLASAAQHRYPLAQPALMVARAMIAAPFAASGLTKAADFAGAVAEVSILTGIESYAPAALMAATVVLTQIVASAAVIWGRRSAVVGALALAGFTTVATLLAHAWWEQTGAERARHFATFFAHVAIVGGLLLVSRVERLRSESA